MNEAVFISFENNMTKLLIQIASFNFILFNI